jgi:hypothetical protein
MFISLTPAEALTNSTTSLLGGGSAMLHVSSGAGEMRSALCILSESCASLAVTEVHKNTFMKSCCTVGADCVPRLPDHR